MKNMMINRLFIFSIPEKRAKVVNFNEGINIITSSKVDGAKRGKSALLKSIYHTLGADCAYEGIWDTQNKTYVVEFTINYQKYVIYRYDRLFKIFDSDVNLLFETIDRQELSTILSDIYEFNIKLPNKQDDSLEIAPPAFSYLLNYVDQDGMHGTYFSSFKNLAQYSNFKENVLYGHFGVFNDEYYNLIKEIEKLNDKSNNLNDELSLLIRMIEKITTDISGNDYSSTMEALQTEIDKNRLEYTQISEKLTTTKNQLIDLRNQEYELKKNIEELKDILKLHNKEIDKLSKHLCPVCNNQIEDTLGIKVATYNNIDDVIILQSSLEVSIHQIKKKIQDKEKVYKSTLDLLNKYNKKISNDSREVAGILRHKGFIEVKDQLSYDWKSTKDQLDIVDANLKEQNKKKREYDDIKKQINKKYCELMLNDKQFFGLQEIPSDKLQHIRSVFSAGGSNMPIATIIWYFNLLKVKRIFNPDAIRFPLVLDSPNNTELDDEKRNLLFNYVFENRDHDTQLIVSTLGFDQSEYPSYQINNIIELTNEPYKLLSSEDYELHYEYLLKLTRSEIQ